MERQQGDMLLRPIAIDSDITVKSLAQKRHQYSSRHAKDSYAVIVIRSSLGSRSNGP